MLEIREVKFLKIVCIGDSLTRGYKIKGSEVWTRLVQDRLEFQVLNKGVIGDTCQEMLGRFQRDVIEKKPTYVIIMGGINDLIKQVPAAVVYSNIIAMVHKAQDSKIIPIIGIQMLTVPALAEQYWPGVTNFNIVNKELTYIRELIIEFANRFHVQIIDFYSEIYKNFDMRNKYDLYIDGVHLSAKGNEIMANKVKI
jgi:acyl-CoA thioesterase I